MKLIIQVPCYNEEEHLPVTLGQIPHRIEGVDRVETLVIDDGSTDRTVEVARAFGADHVVSLMCHHGLAAAFKAGLEASLQRGADIVVNTDGDNQYQADDVVRLIAPILQGRAHLVVGVRAIDEIPHFSFLKKKLQRLGSRVVSRIAGLNVPDVTSGFRAYSREAALKLNVVSDYTYVLETLIQAGQMNIAVAVVPVRINPQLRRSRLIPSTARYVARSVLTILRIFLMYQPLRFFLTLGAVVFGAGFAVGARYLYFYFDQAGRGHVQSLILAAVLMLAGFQIMILGLVGDIIAANRKLLEEMSYRSRARELGLHVNVDPASTHDRSRAVRA